MAYNYIKHNIFWKYTFQEKKDSIVAKCLEYVFSAVETGQNKKSYIFREIGVPEIKYDLQNFQNLIALSVPCLGFIKIFDWFANGTALV